MRLRWPFCFIALDRPALGPRFYFDDTQSTMGGELHRRRDSRAHQTAAADWKPSSRRCRQRRSPTVQPSLAAARPLLTATDCGGDRQVVTTDNVLDALDLIEHVLHAVYAYRTQGVGVLP